METVILLFFFYGVHCHKLLLHTDVSSFKDDRTVYYKLYVESVFNIRFNGLNYM
jgi:hypothetical protein